MLRAPPFKRAVLLAFRQPVVLLVLVGAGLSLGLTSALTPLFLSSAASGALERELEGRCPTSYAGSLSVSPRLGDQSDSFSVSSANLETLRVAVSGQSHLEDPIGTIQAQTVQARVGGGSDAFLPLVVLHRTGFQQHVEVIAGGDGPGVWIDERTAAQLAVGVGDRISYEFVAFDGPLGLFEGEFPVAAIVGDLIDRHTEDFWCGVQSLIGPGPFGDPPPGVALVELDVFGSARFQSAPVQTFFPQEWGWEIPIQTDVISATDAEEILEKFAEVGQVLVGDPERIDSDLEVVVPRILSLKRALTTSIRPLSLVVVFAAFGLMAGAGSFWVDRRTNEVRLLNAVGVGPVGLGFKAVLEAFLPVALGVAAGALLATPIASWIGPSRAIEAEAIRQGSRLAVAAGSVGLFLVGAVVASRSRSFSGRPRRVRASVGLLGVAIAGMGLGALVVGTRLGDNVVRFEQNELVGTVDPLVFVYPALLFATASLTAGLILVGIARFGASRPNRTVPRHLAMRRLHRFRMAAVVLVTGVALPTAVFVYSAVLTRSTELTIQAKGRVFIGSDVRAPVYDLGELPPRLASNSTFVQRADRVDFEGTRVDLLAINPDTFPNGAFWDPSLADVPLAELLELIADPGQEWVPALVANADAPSLRGEVRVGRLDIPVEVAASTDSFPGARRDRPLVVISQANLGALIEDSGLPIVPLVDWIWARDLDEEAVRDDLIKAGIGFSFTTSAERALDLTKFQVIIWTFAFLRLYAVLAGAIAVGAILLYADSQQRRRNLSYVLARRMGLRRPDHIRAALLELGSAVALGSCAGLIAAVAVANSVYYRLDPLPQTPPTPRWELPLVVAGVVLFGALVISVSAAWLAQRTADRADVPDLLRHHDE